MSFTVPGRCVADVEPSGGRFRPGSFRVRARGERVTAQWVASSRYDAPPSFRGRLTPDGRVCGTIREARSKTGFVRGYAFLALVTLAVLAAGAVELLRGSDGWPPLMIGLLATPVFALLARAFHRSRADFGASADHLAASVEQYVATGDPGEY